MKHLHQNQEFRLNEILFEHRNKEYGAYVLRNESDRLLTKALFVGVGLLAAISITPMIISAFKTKPSVHIPTDGPPVVIKLKKVEDPPVQIVKPAQPVSPPPSVKTYDARIYEPKRDAVEIEKKKNMPTDAAPSIQDNSDGESVKSNTYVPTTSTTGTGPIVPEVKPLPPVEKTDPNKIEDRPAVEADFEGGINVFRKKVTNTFDGSGFEGSGKTTITFIVETDGTISGIKANGEDADFNNEAIRTIRSIKGKWIPGKNKKGEAVRSYFKFPISMKFE